MKVLQAQWADLLTDQGRVPRKLLEGGLAQGRAQGSNRYF